MLDEVKLTATVKAAGCAAKLSPSILDTVLRRLPRQTDDNVLVGFETSDDAGVYRLSGGLALVQTLDFFTPIVDEPFSFGQIAAANATFDVMRIPINEDTANNAAALSVIKGYIDQFAGHRAILCMFGTATAGHGRTADLGPFDRGLSRKG